MSNLQEKRALTLMLKMQEERGGKKIKLRWNTPNEVRRSLAKVNNYTINGILTPQQANAVYYGANLILSAIRLSEGIDKEQQD